MKKALLFLIVFMLIFPTVVSAVYEVDKSYKKDKEYILVNVTCIGVDSEENVYLGSDLFNAIQVYTNKGKFLHSIEIKTSGSFDFIVDEYIWVDVFRADRILKFDLDGYLLEEIKIGGEESLEGIEWKYVIKDGTTYRLKGAFGYYSVWKEQDGNEEKMFNLPIKHFLLNLLFIIGFIAFSIYAGIKAYRFWNCDFKTDSSSDDDSSDDDSSDDKLDDSLALERENYNRHEQSH